MDPPPLYFHSHKREPNYLMQTITKFWACLEHNMQKCSLIYRFQFMKLNTDKFTKLLILQ